MKTHDGRAPMISDNRIQWYLWVQPLNIQWDQTWRHSTSTSSYYRKDEASPSWMLLSALFKRLFPLTIGEGLTKSRLQPTRKKQYRWSSNQCLAQEVRDTYEFSSEFGIICPMKIVSEFREDVLFKDLGKQRGRHRGPRSYFQYDLALTSEDVC